MHTENPVTIFNMSFTNEKQIFKCFKFNFSKFLCVNLSTEIKNIIITILFFSQFQLAYYRYSIPLGSASLLILQNFYIILGLGFYF